MQEINELLDDYSMNTPKTIYSYGLNNRLRKHDKNIPVGPLFPPLPGATKLPPRPRNNINLPIFSYLEMPFKMPFII